MKFCLIPLLLSGMLIGSLEALTVKLNQRPKMVQASKGMPLRNIDLIEYYGRMDIGAPPQSFDVVFDTTMDWTWLPSEMCIECHYCDRFYPEDSRTYESLHKDVVFHYTTGEAEADIHGTLSRDTVTINYKTVPLQPFLVVNYDGGIFPNLHSSGFVGLSLKEDKDYLSFVRQLKLMRLIDKAIFAIRLSNVKNDDNSEISFGEYNEKIIGPNRIIWEEVKSDDKWLLNIKKMSFGDLPLNLHSDLTEVATAEAHLRMTRSDFEPIESYLRAKYQCTYSISSFLFYCYVGSESLDDFPPISISFENLQLSLPDRESGTGKKIAIIQIEVFPNQALKYNAIGTVLLRNYYTIFDMDNKPLPEAEKGTNLGLILGILLPVLIVLLLVGGYLGYRKYKYGTWIGKSTTQIVNDQALLASNTL